MGLKVLMIGAYTLEPDLMNGGGLTGQPESGGFILMFESLLVEEK
jgi:hypothetical protein